MANKVEAIKCVVVGDSNVGKTSLLMVFTDKDFPRKYTPTIEDYYTMDLSIDGKTLKLEFWDTAGQEKYDRIRPTLSYVNTDVALICFSLVNVLSFANAETKWYPEILENCPNVPIILVGTKLDERDLQELEDPHQRLPFISFERGLQLKKDIGALTYVETSAKTQLGLQRAFEEVIRAAYAPPPSPCNEQEKKIPINRDRCSLM